MRPFRLFLLGFALGMATLFGLLVWKGVVARSRETAVPAAAAWLSSSPAASPGGPTPFPPGTISPPPLPGGADEADLLTPVRPRVARPTVGGADLDRLRARGLLFPVEGFDFTALRNDFDEARGDHRHEALDLLAPRATPVRAVDDGRIEKLFTSERGGLTVYQFDPTETYCYYYAHLDRYTRGLAEGQFVRKGERIGEVGTTGNAPPNTPHLHFAILKLGPEKRWWEGVALNPYPLWAPAATAMR